MLLKTKPVLIKPTYRCYQSVFHQSAIFFSYRILIKNKSNVTKDYYNEIKKNYNIHKIIKYNSIKYKCIIHSSYLLHENYYLV